MRHRLQEKRQQGDDTGYDEDWYYLTSTSRPSHSSRTMDEQTTDKDLSGHVERTNDRDYEVEERLNYWL